MRAYLPLLLVLVFGPRANAQDTLAETPLISGMYMGIGSFGYSAPSLTQQQFSLLAPTSVLLSQDLSDHDYFSTTDSYGQESFSGGLELNLFRNKPTRRSNVQLRLGLQYVRMDGASGAWSYEDRTPYDTLTSSQTGGSFRVDSVFRSYYYAYQYSDQLGLDAAMIFRKVTSSRWTLHAGFGVGFALRFNSTLQVTHSTHSYFDGPYELYTDQPRYPEHVVENNRMENSTALMAYGVFGLDFRLGRENVFWRQLHLFLEVRPTLMHENLPTLGGYTSVGFQSLFGLRLDL